MLYVLGIIHLIHCPLLIMYPYVTVYYDKLYISYFLLIIMSYLLCKNECLISYCAKKITNTSYIAGSKMNYYPEMYMFTKNDTFIQFYFAITTLIYINSLYMVIIRNVT
jgi:hypothetical protein